MFALSHKQKTVMLLRTIVHSALVINIILSYF